MQSEERLEHDANSRETNTFQSYHFSSVFIKLLFGICIIILFWYTIPNNNLKILIISNFNNLYNYKQLLFNDRILDTYYQRIQQFLNETNVSLSSYEPLN